jgi:colicin import membrane protein
MEEIVSKHQSTVQKRWILPSYRHYFIYAILLHAVVLVLLVGGFVIADHPTQLASHTIQASVQKNIPKDKATVAAEQRARAKAIARTKAIAKAKTAAKAKAEQLHQLALARERIKVRKAKFARLRQEALAHKQAALNKRMMERQLHSEQARLHQAKIAAQAAAQAKRNAQEINQYQQRILQAISQVWVIPRGVNPKLYCVVALDLAPDGSVLKASISQGSGSSVLDQSALQAVYQASPLPVPSNPALFSEFRNLRLTLRPEKIVHVT